jgi:IclR family transcriptional regulator, pca regulon regulatory protein
VRPPSITVDWPKSSDAFVEAFAKGLAVISSFGDGRDRLSISDVAARTGLDRAGARRLLLTLVHLGFATQHDGRFVLTPRVLRLGFAYLSSLSLREIAQPLIENLSKSVNEPVAVSVIDGDEIVYVARATSARVLSRQLVVGSRLPAYCTSMGRVLLAAKTPAELDHYLSITDLVPLTRHTLTDKEALRQEIGRVRRQGWAIVVNELELGVCGLAAAVRDNNGKVVAAINLSANLSRYTKASYIETCLPPLLDVARVVSGQLQAETREDPRQNRSRLG